MAAGGHGDHGPASVDWAAVAGGARQTTATAVERTKARLRLPVMGCPYSEFISESPATGGHTGASGGSCRGEPVMGRETHHELWLYTPCVFGATLTLTSAVPASEARLDETFLMLRLPKGLDQSLSLST